MPVTHTDASEIANKVSSGDTVLLDTSRPASVGRALAQRSDLQDVTVYEFGTVLTEPAPLDDLALNPRFDVRVSMASPPIRDFVEDGSIGFVPRTFYDVAMRPLLDDSERVFAIIETPPVTNDTLHDLGCMSAYGESLASYADVTIIEENVRVPSVANPKYMPTASIDFAVEVDRELPVLGSGDVRDCHSTIADNIGELIPKGASIQSGIGAIYPELARVFSSIEDTRIWTGLISNGVQTLVDSDNINSITGCCMFGKDAEFYEWLAAEQPEKIHLKPTSETHALNVLHEQSPFIAINSAIQVDLCGNVNAERIAGRQIAGVGGQIDFMYAAATDPDSLALIALPSRSPAGHPAIVPSLGADEAVTTPRYCVDGVVTEFGTALLQNRTPAERARNLVSVAHPDDREKLEESLDT